MEPIKQTAAAPTYWQRTIAAGGNAQIEGVGDFFYLLRVASSSPDALTQVDIAQSGTQEYITLANGQGLNIARGFNGLYIKNPQAYPVTVTIIYGYRDGGAVIDNSLQIISNLLQSVIQSVDKKTEVVPYAPTTIAAATTIAFPGTPTATQLYRRTIYVGNGDNVGNLEIFHGGVRMGIVFPQTTFALDTSDPVSVRNPSGAPVVCAIGEVFYRA